MVRYENDCVGCPQGCIGCGRKHSPHYYCNKCGEEITDLDVNTYSDYHLCDSCEDKEDD